MLPSEIAQFAEQYSRHGRRVGDTGDRDHVGELSCDRRYKAAAVAADLEEAGGSLMVLKQPADANLDCWGTLPDSFPLMREIKRRFDPDGMLNPGRFLGGI